MPKGKPGHGKHWLRRLIWGTLALALLPPLLLTLALLGLDTTPGRDWLARQINRSESVKIEAVEGSLWGRMALRGLRVDNADFSLSADRIELDWQPYSLLLKRLQVDSFKAGRVELAPKSAPPDRPPTQLPTDLRLPLGITLTEGEIGLLQIRDLAFSAIRFNFASDGRKHRFELAELKTRYGRSEASLALDGKAPFLASGRFAFRGEIEGHALATQGHVNGKLRDLALAALIENPQAKGKIDARLDLFAPYAYQMLREGRIGIEHFNPARLLAGLPQAELDLRLDLRPTGQQSAAGELEIVNHRPGAIDAGRIPVSKLKAKLAYSDEMLRFSALDAAVSSGRITGQGTIAQGQLGLEFAIARLDLAGLLSRQPATSLDGKLALTGPWLAPDIRADLADAPRRVRLQTDLGWINPQHERRLQIRTAKLQRGASELTASGEFGLQDKLDFRLTGEFRRVNPAEFIAVPAGSLSGSLKTEGHLQPRPAVALDYKLADSRFNNELLQGQGSLRLEESRLAAADFWLMLGRNRVDAKGSLGAASDTLQATLDLSQLRSFGPGFSGSARGSIHVSGKFADPVLEGRLDLADLATPLGFAVGRAHLQARLQQGIQAPLSLQLDAERFRQGALLLEKLHARIDGSRGGHEARLNLAGKASEQAVELQALLAGGFDSDWRWRGILREFSANGPVLLRLAGSTSLEAGRDRISLGDSRWTLGAAQLQLQRTSWQAGQIESAGKLSHLSLEQAFAVAGVHDYLSDLILGGDWQLRFDPKNNDLNGEIRLAREAGDSLWQVATKRLPFELQQASLQLKAQHNRISLAGLFSSARYGKLELEGEARLDPAAGKLAEAMNLRLRGELPQLAAFNPLIGPDLQLGGRLVFDVQRSGFIQTTALSGSVSGDSMTVRDLASGLNLHDGIVRMALADQRILLQQAVFKGGQGDLRATGVIDLRGESAQAEVTANRLTLFSRSDLLLVLSGQGRLTSQKGQIDISGKLRADRGDIEYRSAEVPRLSDDVVVLGRERPAPKALPPLSLSVDVDLGDDFRFRGYGLDAKLDGLLRLRAQPARPLAAHGVVRVKEGHYRAWGRQLEIERGQLSFQGAVDNPGLDILAMRCNQSIEAGVSVLGTALNPRVMLYSEPAVPDTEKLAWLLFGHGTEGMEKSDSVLLLQATNALLTGNGHGKGLTDEILGRIGLDDVGMRSVRETDGRSTQIVTVSKQLGRKLRVSLEKSINGLRDAVKLSLQLSRRWSLDTRIGNDESSAGMVYTIQFE